MRTKSLSPPPTPAPITPAVLCVTARPIYWLLFVFLPNTKRGQNFGLYNSYTQSAAAIKLVKDNYLLRNEFLRSRGCTSPGLMTRLSRVMITLFMLPVDMVLCRFFSSNNLQTRNNLAIFLLSVTIM